MKKFIFLGYDINSTGGIPTYSRHQINSLKEIGEVFVVNFESKKADSKNIKTYKIKHYGIYRKISSLIGFFKLVSLSLFFSPHVIVVNHVNLAPMAQIIKFIFGTKYTLNMYNVDVLGELTVVRKKALLNADILYGDCSFVIKEALNKYRFNSPSVLLYDPVDLSKYQSKSKESARKEVENIINSSIKDKIVITTVAMFQPSLNKGHIDIINSLSRLEDKNFIYIMTGIGPTRKKVEDLVNILNLNDQVFFLGRVEEELIPSIYISSDIVSLISRNAPATSYGSGEGIPLGLVEGLGAGRAIICGNQDGSIEAFNNSYPNGIVVDPDNQSEIDEALIYFKDNPNELYLMGRNSLKHAKEYFTKEKFSKILHDSLDKNL